MDTDCNPPPPPEILNNSLLVPDRIGNSLYSKKWCYKTLMSIIEFSDKPAEAKHSSDKMENGVNNSVMVELDPKIEEDACNLWDMTANEEVATFLNETGVPAICMDVIDKTESPRLLEIIIGILGNMSSFDAICQNISANQNLVYSIILLSGTSDTPTLLQVFRVVLCGVSNENCKSSWLEAFEKNSFFMENLKFIFVNSLNCSVLKQALQLLHGILVSSNEYCEKWGQSTSAIIGAGKQLMKQCEVSDYFFFVLDALCQYSPNIQQLGDHVEDLSPVFAECFSSLAEEENFPIKSGISAASSCCEIYHSLLKLDNIKHELLLKDSNVVGDLCEFYSSVRNLISNVKENNSEMQGVENSEMGISEDILLRRTEEKNGSKCTCMMTQHEFRIWTDLADVILDMAKTLLLHVKKESDKKMIESLFNSNEKRTVNVSVT